MTVEEVQSLIKAQSEGSFPKKHHKELKQLLIPPRKIPLMIRNVVDGRVKEQIINVWLVGREGDDDGYSIVMREDGEQFGLASTGFPNDKHLILTGWYGGTLPCAFLNM
jgi:hypothetical protein